MNDVAHTQKQVILIFGAGVNQLELIREAKKLGIVTVVIDPQADPPGKTEADCFYQVEGPDYDTTLKIARQHHVNGIVTGQMEKPMRLMARLAQDLHLIFHTPEVTERSLDKWLMKEAFITGGVPCARGMLIPPSTRLNLDDLEGFSFPVITKPRDAFSSRGVLKSSSPGELIDHINESFKYTSQGDIILEEFLEGKEYSVESVTYRGTTTVIQITEKFITSYPYTVEMGHLQPAQLDENDKREVTDAVKKAINAIGIDNSASHTEVMMTSNGPALIEIGARLGGDFIASYLTRASTGISMDRAAVQVAMGMTPDLTPLCNRFSLIRYLELPAGMKVKEILSIDAVMKMPGVIFTHIFLNEGDMTSAITHSALRPACVMVEADSREECMRMAEEALKELKRTIVITKIKGHA